MIYLERIWRGLQLGLDLFLLRMFFLNVIASGNVWYCVLMNCLAIGGFVAIAINDFVMLKNLFRKPRKHADGAD